MILINGEARSEISAMDRGLAYGDGIFRTFPARQGQPLSWRRHYAKLAHDAGVLKLAMPEADVLESEVRAVCKDHGACAVKIVLTRGAGLRGYRYAGDERPTRIVSAGPLPAEAIENRSRGVKVRLCSLRLAAQPALAGVKHLNRLENVLARAEWQDPQIAEGILCDDQGHVISGTMTNIFIAVDGALATPGLDRCGVAGVTRERVMQAAEPNGISCMVTTLSWTDVQGADEVFLVNSLAGAWPVRDLNGEARVPGAMTRAVQQWLDVEDDA
ncbi:MAG TPA: aminodeoxychorismate lyase [Burkholderiales bacterium]|nr:aminodeoxychorismate lyase [Burkholderiales bacterium]